MTINREPIEQLGLKVDIEENGDIFISRVSNSDDYFTINIHTMDFLFPSESYNIPRFSYEEMKTIIENINK